MRKAKLPRPFSTSPVDQHTINALQGAIVLDLRSGVYLLTHRLQFATAFMRSYAAYQRLTADPDQGLDPSFIQFLRLIDPSIPQKPREYRKHPTYHTAMYLKRLAEKGK